jgi:hypothetical protein
VGLCAALTVGSVLPAVPVAAQNHLIPVGIFMPKPQFCNLPGGLTKEICENRRAIFKLLKESLEDEFAKMERVSLYTEYPKPKSLAESGGSRPTALAFAEENAVRFLIRIDIPGKPLRSDKDRWLVSVDIFDRSIQRQSADNDWEREIGQRVGERHLEIAAGSGESADNAAKGVAVTLKRLYPESAGSKDVFVGCFEQYVVNNLSDNDLAISILALKDQLPVRLAQFLDDDRFHQRARDLEGLNRYVVRLIKEAVLIRKCRGEGDTSDYDDLVAEVWYVIVGKIERDLNLNELTIVMHVESGSDENLRQDPLPKFRFDEHTLNQGPGGLMPDLASHIWDNWEDVVSARQGQ